MRKLGGRKPVGPDLWLITPDEHKFIEVKLPAIALRRINYSDWPSLELSFEPTVRYQWRS